MTDKKNNTQNWVEERNDRQKKTRTFDKSEGTLRNPKYPKEP